MDEMYSLIAFFLCIMIHHSRQQRAILVLQQINAAGDE